MPVINFGWAAACSACRQNFITKNTRMYPVPAFHLGICMAGAVSAGAYTAGVIDYLLEALEDWERRRNEPGVPQHRVLLSVIGGASAGGMTGLITAAALEEHLQPLRAEDPATRHYDPVILQRKPEHRLYHSWVDLTQDDMFPRMLRTDDIGKGFVASLLNASFIDEIADRAVTLYTGRLRSHPAAYIHPNLRLFTTLSNLCGFSYNVDMRSTVPGSSKYYMAVHKDFACFEIGEPPAGSATCWMPLRFREPQLNVSIARAAAMATGAFPVGLKARMVSRPVAYVNAQTFCGPVLQKFPVTTDPYVSLNIDGGMINNEPFECVRKELNALAGEDAETRSFRDFHTFKSTVLLIDPFPSKPPDACNHEVGLGNVLVRTLGAMIAQMRSKPELLEEAMDATCAGHFLIAPARRVPLPGGGEEDLAGDRAIACGALGGFSGFLSKEFRIHDYHLGRFNCEQFLRYYFTIPDSALAHHDLFRKGYAGVELNRFRSRKTGGLQIIPLFSQPCPENRLPIPVFRNGSNWPLVEKRELEALRPLIKKRVEALLLRGTGVSGLTRMLLYIGSRVVLRRKVTQEVLKALHKDLRTHLLLEP